MSEIHSETIRASDSASLVSTVARQRRSGRIGGFSASRSNAAREGMLCALGVGAAILGTEPNDFNNFVIDSDSCWFESRRLLRRDDWIKLLARDKLADVKGAFALAWRRTDGALVLARDAIGERALFYALIPDGIVFASTLHAVLATGLVERSLDLVALASYLVHAYLPGEETLVEGVRELLPGETLTWKNGEIKRERFWRIPHDQQDAHVDEETLCAKLRADLETAIRRRLDPGEPIAATLSGGVDSSLVVALLRRLHDGDIHTFSVFFGDSYANELKWSSMVADHCGTRHAIVEIPPAAIVQHLDDTIALLSDPIGDPLTVPNALLFREASRVSGCVFNGEGGDPSFGGPKNLPMILSELFDDADDPDSRARAYLRAHQKCYDDLAEMLSPEARHVLEGDPLERRIAPCLEEPRWKSFVNRLNAINVSFKGPHHILGKVDHISFPFGVVPRSPLFDRDVVETAFAIPAQFKLKGSVEKHLLKRAVEDLLPKAIIDRPKCGMLVPVEGWFKGELLPIARERIMDGLAPYGIFQRDWLDRLIRNKLGGVRPRRGVKIWLLVTLEAWLRRVYR